jgi:RNA polymerase subunit RPABC4/transcription elongation factor Spt4
MGGNFLFWLGVFRDFAIVVALLVWAASIGWVVRDATERGVNKVAALALAVVFPYVGAFLYALVRPRTRLAELRERELWVQLAEATARVERCHACRTPIERDFVACPSCAAVLRKRCTGCGSAVELSWAACPYCGEHEDAAAWTEQEPARAAAAVTELKPAKRPRARSKRPPKTESAL